MWPAIGILCLLVLGYKGWDYLLHGRTRFIRYKEFGIEIPVNYRIHGIDVSRYQQAIDWKEVKNMEVRGVKVGFAFIKATEGINDNDGFFKRNWQGAKKAGVVRGAYHYFLPDRSGKSQAQNFFNAVDLEPGDLPPVLDIEELAGASRASLQKELKAFLDETELRYGVKPIIYSNVDFYEKNLAGAFEEYPLWVAHYLQRDRPRISRNWVFWQHSEKARVNGIDSPVDFNAFYGDSSDFKALLLR